MQTLLPEIRALLSEDRVPDLGPGSPNLAVRAALEELADSLTGKAKNRNFALACLAGLWLFHDFLDESHAISQDLHTLEGSYWHGILHRREPDYWNAKYWFRRVPTHPIHEKLRRKAAEATRDAGVPAGCGFLIEQMTWNAAAFVDLCENAADEPSFTRGLCRWIQRQEWVLLFTYCHVRAFTS